MFILREIRADEAKQIPLHLTKEFKRRYGKYFTNFRVQDTFLRGGRFFKAYLGDSNTTHNELYKRIDSFIKRKPYINYANESEIIHTSWFISEYGNKDAQERLKKLLLSLKEKWQTRWSKDSNKWHIKYLCKSAKELKISLKLSELYAIEWQEINKDYFEHVRTYEEIQHEKGGFFSEKDFIKGWFHVERDGRFFMGVVYFGTSVSTIHKSLDSFIKNKELNELKINKGA